MCACACVCASVCLCPKLLDIIFAYGKSHFCMNFRTGSSISTKKLKNVLGIQTDPGFIHPVLWESSILFWSMDEGSEANLQGRFRFHSKDWGQQIPLAPFPLYTNRADLSLLQRSTTKTWHQSAAGSGVTMRQGCLRDSDKYLPDSVYETETALSGQLGWAKQSLWTILVYSQTIPTPCGRGAGGGGETGSCHC